MYLPEKHARKKRKKIKLDEVNMANNRINMQDKQKPHNRKTKSVILFTNDF